MRKTDCLNKLKTNFYNEYGLFLKEENEVERAKVNVDLIDELINQLNSNDIYELYDNRYYIYSLLEELTTNENNQILNSLIKDKLDKVFYSYFNNQGLIEESFIEEAMKKIEKAKKICEETSDNLEAQYEILNREYIKKKNYIYEYKEIHKNFKMGFPINRYQENIIKEYMKNNSFTDDEQVLVLEAIRTHNMKNIKHLENYPPSIVEKMINNHMKKFEIDELDEGEFNSKYYDMSIDIYRSLLNMDIEKNFDDAYAILPKEEDGYTPREFKYIYNLILNSILDDIYECIDTVSNVDSYVDKDLKNAALMSYNEYMSKYFLVFKKYKKENEKYGSLAEETDEIEETEADEIDESDDEINTLTYLQNGDVSEVERDLKNINNAYYDTLLNLLKRKKKGNLPSSKDSIMKNTNATLAGFGKLEKDQVRVLYKPEGDRVYLIIGAFVKKDTDVLVGYNALAKRYRNAEIPPKEKQIKNAKAVEDSLFKKLVEERRIPDR